MALRSSSSSSDSGESEEEESSDLNSSDDEDESLYVSTSSDNTPVPRNTNSKPQHLNGKANASNKYTASLPRTQLSTFAAPALGALDLGPSGANAAAKNVLI